MKQYVKSHSMYKRQQYSTWNVSKFLSVQVPALSVLLTIWITDRCGGNMVISVDSNFEKKVTLKSNR